MLKTKWLIYTVIIGLIPFLIRAMLWFFIKRTDIGYILNTTDMVIFGLVLHLSNINELEDRDKIDRVWKSSRIGISIVSIVILAAHLMVAYFSEFDTGKIVNTDNLKYSALVFSIVSFVFSYSIFDRLNISDD